jgi:integrase
VIRLSKKLVIPKLGSRLLVEVTRDDWTGLIATVRKRAPATGAWLYGLVSAFLSHAEAFGWVPTNVLPRRGKSRIAPHPAARSRVLSDEELVSVWLVTEQLSPRTRCFVRFLIMTAARLNEVADMAVGEFDLKAACWTIPAERAKNRTAITLPLHSLLLGELGEIWPSFETRSDYRLLGAIAGSGFRGPSSLKRRVDAVSKVSDWRWHDLRRTARTGMTRLGVPREHAEAALNHLGSRTPLERVYDRHDFSDEIIAALLRWQQHVESLVTERMPVKMISVQSRR